jgi:hypothetical protein
MLEHRRQGSLRILDCVARHGMEGADQSTGIRYSVVLRTKAGVRANVDAGDTRI